MSKSDYLELTKNLLMNKIRKAKFMYLAHLIGRNKILTRIVMSKLEGTKSRGRKRLMWL